MNTIPVWMRLFAMIVMQWPFAPEWMPVVRQVQIIPYTNSCRDLARACYYDGTIEVDFFGIEGLDSWNDYERAFIHELGHHLQVESMIWQNPGGWDKFMGIVEDLARSGRYSGHQKGSLAWLASGDWQPHEAHAELPIILKGEIPPELRSWYPWFSISELQQE